MTADEQIEVVIAAVRKVQMQENPFDDPTDEDYQPDYNSLGAMLDNAWFVGKERTSRSILEDCAKAALAVLAGETISARTP